MHRKLKIVVLLWLTFLTLTAGYTNGLSVCYLGTPLTHHTGNITNLAIILATGKTYAIMKVACAIFFFFLGCVIAGMFFYNKHIGFSKMFAYVTIIYSLLYIFTNMLFRNEIYLLCSTAFMTGAQNSLLTRYNGITTRTTHMSGYITDAGVYLGRAIRGNRWALKIFLFFFGNVMMFFIGSLVGLYSVSYFGFYSFILAGVMRILSGIYYIIFIYDKDKHQLVLKGF